VINVVQGFRPDVPEEEQLPPGTSSSTCGSHAATTECCVCSLHNTVCLLGCY
jgi:hypothetical protein